MRKHNLKKFIISVFILASVFFVYSHQAQAVGNTQGWAWSENIGWISFNCNNAIQGKEGGTCYDEITNPNGIDYGVNINENTGEFTGYAWSENIGWINFGPLSDFPTTPKIPATLEIKTTCEAEENVTGWAQVISTDGWIKMNGTTQNDKFYKVSRTKEGGRVNLIGWAWSEDFGWISFNCENESNCATANYKVSIFSHSYKPEVENLSVLQDNCTDNGANPQVKLHWIFKGCKTDDNQTAYRIQIDDDQFIDPIIINKKKTGANKIYSTIIEDGNALQYGITAEKSYFWRVMVQTNGVEWSDWSSTQTFSTPKHPYPEASLKCSIDPNENREYIDCNKLSVSANQKVYFKGNDPEPCGGIEPPLSPECTGVVIKKRIWGFGVSCPSNPCLLGETCNANNVCEKTITGEDAKTNWTTRTYSAGSLPNKGLSLEITDSSIYECPTSGTSFENSKVNFPLPIWKEVIPKD